MYCTIDDILQDYSQTDILQLVNDENETETDIDLTNGTNIATARILAQITAADDEIDGYLRSRYTLPLTSIPQRVKQISKDIAIYNLHKRRLRTQMPDSIIALYKMDIAELDRIQKGFVILDINSSSAIEVANAEIVTNKRKQDRMFPREILSNY